jgi:hypothetical protein
MVEIKEGDGWKEWSKYVLITLEHQNELIDKLSDKLDLSSKELREKVEYVNEKLGGRLTLLQAKVAGIAIASSLLTTIIFFLLSRLLGGKGP